MQDEIVVRKEIEIDAPVSKVWEALTSTNYTKKYMFALDVESDWKAGSPVVWTGDAGGVKTFRKGRVLAVDPRKFLRFSDFNPSTGAKDVEENYAHVSYELTSLGDKTMLTVLTDHLNSDEARRKDSEGFWGRVLPALKKLLEKQ